MGHGQCNAKPTVTFPAAWRHCRLTVPNYRSYRLVTEACHVCEQPAQGCYLKAVRPGIKPFANTLTIFTTWQHIAPVPNPNPNLNPWLDNPMTLHRDDGFLRGRYLGDKCPVSLARHRLGRFEIIHQSKFYRKHSWRGRGDGSRPLPSPGNCNAAKSHNLARAFRAFAQLNPDMIVEIVTTVGDVIGIIKHVEILRVLFLQCLKTK